MTLKHLFKEVDISKRLKYKFPMQIDQFISQERRHKNDTLISKYKEANDDHLFEGIIDAYPEAITTNSQANTCKVNKIKVATWSLTIGIVLVASAIVFTII